MKKLLIGVGAVIAVLIVAGVLAPYFISADALKGQILAQVQNATGRQLQIGGPLSLGVFPNVEIEATDVTLANVPGAASPAMAKLKQLNLAVRLIPLLSGQIEIERLAVVDPAIDLEIDAQGRPSWSFGGAAAAGAAPTGNAAMLGLAALSRLRVKEVSIQNGDIVFLDRRTGRREELRQATLTLSAPSLDAPFTADGSAVWRGQKIAISARLDNLGALIQAGGKTKLAMSVTAQPVTFKLGGDVGNSGGDLVFDGTVDLAAPSLRNLVAWYGQPVALPQRGFGALAIGGTVHVQNGVAKFANGNFTLDTIKAAGALTLDARGAKPNVTGHLATGMLDFNPYLGPSKPGWDSDPFDAALLRQVNADLTVEAEGVRYRKMQIGKAVAAVHLKDGKLALNVSQVALYRGTAKGTVDVDVTGDSAAATIDGSVSGVDLAALLRDAGGGGDVGGAGSFTVAGTARGNSERDLISTLSGRAAFQVSGGSLHGVDLGGMLKNTASAFAGGGATAIEHASGTYTIRNGIMSNRDLRVSTSVVDATGAGTVNLPARTLDYRIEPKLIAGIVTVPVIVRGPWDHLNYEPDLAGIAKGVVEAPMKAIGGAAQGAGKVGEGVGEGVGGVAKGVGGAIKSLFGN